MTGVPAVVRRWLVDRGYRVHRAPGAVEAVNDGGEIRYRIGRTAGGFELRNRERGLDTGFSVWTARFDDAVKVLCWTVAEPGPALAPAYGALRAEDTGAEVRVHDADGVRAVFRTAAREAEAASFRRYADASVQELVDRLSAARRGAVSP